MSKKITMLSHSGFKVEVQGRDEDGKFIEVAEFTFDGGKFAEVSLGDGETIRVSFPEAKDD